MYFMCNYYFKTFCKCNLKILNKNVFRKLYIKNFREAQFSDLQNFIETIRDKRHPAAFEDVIIREVPHDHNPTLGEILKIKIT